MKRKPSRKNKPVWGLTGGIASGKSLVARFFEEEGWTVVDADQVSRDLSSPGGAAEPAIRARFGTTDRSELRQKIFSDPLARRDLEAILHPLIRMESLGRMRASDRPVIYEAALLVERGRHRDFDGLIVVVSPREDRIRRLMERDRCSRESAEAIIAAQISDDERRAHATHLIENLGSEAELQVKVHALSKKLKEKS